MNFCKWIPDRLSKLPILACLDFVLCNSPATVGPGTQKGMRKQVKINIGEKTRWRPRQLSQESVCKVSSKNQKPLFGILIFVRIIS